MIGLLSVVPLSPAFGADEEALLDAIFEAWKARFERVQTARFDWTLKVEDRDVGPNPDDVAQYENTCVYVFGAGQRRRYEAKGWQGKYEGGIQSLNCVFTDNGAGEWRELYHPSERFNFPTGLIEERQWGRREFIPLLLCFGRMMGRSAIDRARVQIADTQYQLNKGRGVLVEETESPQSRKRSFVFDPALAYSLVRLIVTDRSGTPDYEFDIRYQKSAEGVYVPQSWTYVLFKPDGTVSCLKEARVTRYALNPEVPEETFLLEFPVGTSVYDAKTRERFIQRANGRRRVITPAEEQALVPYSVLLQTESGQTLRELQSPASPRRRSELWLVVANVVVVAVVLGVARFRKRRSDRSPKV